MTKQEAIARLRQCKNNADIEFAHMEADQILCDLLTTLGYGDVVEEFEKLDKWYA